MSYKHYNDLYERLCKLESQLPEGEFSKENISDVKVVLETGRLFFQNHKLDISDLLKLGNIKEAFSFKDKNKELGIDVVKLQNNLKKTIKLLDQLRSETKATEDAAEDLYKYR